MGSPKAVGAAWSVSALGALAFAVVVETPLAVPIALWSAGSFLMSGSKYVCGESAALAADFGKGEDGTLSAGGVLRMGPTIAVSFSIWMVRRTLAASGLVADPPYSLVSRPPVDPSTDEPLHGAIYIGILPLRVADLPPDTRQVVDLTAEYPSAVARRVDNYVCLPCPDVTMPPRDIVGTKLSLVHSWLARGNVYIHCAYGHGRSAAFAAVLMVVDGRADDVFAAASAIKVARPSTCPSAAQLFSAAEGLSCMGVREGGPSPAPAPEPEPVEA